MRRHIHKMTGWSRHIHVWQLVVAAIIFVPLSLYGLRSNNQRMGELLLEVVAADEANKGLEEAMASLSNHVFNHMNTSTQIELKYSYDRAVAKAQKENAAVSGNQALYDRAVAVCNKPGVPGTVRATCVQDYVSKRSRGANPEPPQLPDERLYRYSYAAPLWSPDLAGFSLFGITIAFLIMGIKLIHSSLSPKN